MPLSAVLFRGTGCDQKFMSDVARILRKFGGFGKIDQRCWSIKKNSFNYIDTSEYNIPNRTFDLAIGHSAGGFPLFTTRAKVKIAINPFISEYPRVDWVIHAKDDWLVPPDLFDLDNVLAYSGKHGDVPTKKLNDLLAFLFPGKKKTVTKQDLTSKGPR